MRSSGLSVAKTESTHLGLAFKKAGGMGGTTETAGVLTFLVCADTAKITQKIKAKEKNIFFKMIKTIIVTPK